MKNLFKIGCFILTCSYSILFATNAVAEQALSKKLIQQHANAIKQIEPLLDQHPKIEQQLSDAMLQGKPQMKLLLSQLPDYPKIKTMVTSSGFDSVDQFLDVGLRVMAAMFNQQMKNLPNGMTLDNYMTQLNAQVKAMEQQGLPAEMLTKMKTSLAEQMTNFQMMQKMSEHASAADTKFVGDNLQWVSKVMDAKN